MKHFFANGAIKHLNKGSTTTFVGEPEFSWTDTSGGWT